MEIKRSILTRIGWVYLATALVAVAIIGQVIYIQVVDGETYRLKAEEASERSQIIPANRGDILANDDRLLASSLPKFDLGIDPNSKGITQQSFSQHIDGLAAGLSRLFEDRSAAAYKRLITQARNEGKVYQVLKRNISYKEAEQAKELPLFNLGRYKGGRVLDPVTNREKPYQLLASRTIGYLNEGESGTLVGLEGAYDHQLRGRDGVRLEHRIGGGNYVPLNMDNEQDPVDGLDLITTIDIKYQDVAEQALYDLLQYHKAHHGCAILMEVATGKVLAIANLGRYADEKYYEDFNYAIGERVEPGSTFKLPAIMAALEDGYVSLDDTINTFRGTFQFYDQEVKDSHEGGFGNITVREVIEKSSNIGMARLINRHYRSNPHHFIDRLYGMGLNQPLGIELKGEPAPRIKSPDDADWWGTTLPWMAHGYELEMTPLQMLSFYNAIANNGKMVKPRFVTGFRNHSKVIRETKTEIIKHSICSKATLEKAQELLKGVVQQGTATNLRPKYYNIAGKTGTAVISQGDRGYRAEDGSKAYRASFVGYFPAENPMFSCIVVISRPNMGVYYGNRVAGSVFQTIADKVFATTLALHPTLTISEQLAENPVPAVKSGKWTDLQGLLKKLNIPHHRPAGANLFVNTVREGQQLRVEPFGEIAEVLPDLSGLGMKDILPLLENRGITVKPHGYGTVYSQEPAAGTPLGSINSVTLYLSVNEEHTTISEGNPGT